MNPTNSRESRTTTVAIACQPADEKEIAMYSYWHVNSALALFAATLLCVATLSPFSTLAVAAGNQQAQSAANNSGNRVGRRPARRSSRRRGNSRSVLPNIADESLMNPLLNLPHPGGEPVIPTGNENTPLAETLEYIRLRMKDYGAQSGYSGGEIIKDVTFSNCAAPQSTEQDANSVSHSNIQVATMSDALAQCSISWTVTYKEGGAGTANSPGVDVTRTASFKLKDLNNDGVVIRQGVIWVRTDPYRSITITTGARDAQVEDEWWIDLHNQEVARRVARALQHAAQQCRVKNYVEKFAK
jgi:hypothetical protein